MHSKATKNAWTLVAFAMLSLITPTRAEITNYWINGGSGDASVGTNWSSGLPLAFGQGIAMFTNNASYQVTYPGSTFSDSMYFNASSGVVTNNIPVLLEVYGGTDFRVADAAGSTASVVQVGAGELFANVYVGYNGQGNFTASGATHVNAVTYLYAGINSGSAGSTFVATNGAIVTGSSYTLVGVNAGADNNTVVVTGTNTTWADPYVTELGVNGANNTLRIENGAKYTQTGFEFLVGAVAGSSNNTLLVTGTNSTLTLQEGFGYAPTYSFQIGAGGNNNSLIVSNGGAVQLINGGFTPTNYVYVGTYGAGNSLVVSGPGSTLIMTNSVANLYVGYENGNNRLVVENGGRVLMGGSFYEGYADDYNSSGLTNANNTVLVTGTNSFLGIGGSSMGIGTAYSLPVGSHGNNSFTISNGAAVKFDGTVVSLGYYYAGGSSFTVTGPGSVFSNTAASFGIGFFYVGSRLQIDNGGQFYGSNVNVAAGNSLTVTNGGTMVLSDTLTLANSTLNLVGGSLQTRNSSASGTTVVGGGPDAGTWTMLGGSNSLSVLETGHNGVLLVTNGASLQTAQFYAGVNVSVPGSNSLVVVTGPSSVWSNSSTFEVGYSGAGNTVRIENGARVVSTGTGIAYIGDTAAGASNNTLLVTGSNSLFQTMAADFRVGNFGGNNSLIVSNGGKAQIDGGSTWQLLGTFGSGNNSIKVSGANSALYMTNTAGHIGLGYQAPNNSVLIENGGQWLSGGAITYIGDNTAASSNNTITVTGSNSYWRSTASDFRLGQSGGYNSLIVSNGGKVQLDGGSSYQLVGTVGAGSNLIKVSGAGSSLYWTNTTFHTAFGYQAPNNSLLIENGGQMFSFASSGGSRFMVGEFASSSGNNFTVTGSNSMWRIYADPANTLSELSFGNASGGNTMVISNGGKVQFDGKYFEIGTFAGNNAVTVTGAGSVFSNANATFYTGYQGLNNHLQIDNGGQFYGSNIIVGQTGFTGNGIDVRSGGLLDANQYSVFAGNYITNSGGTFQFSSATPTLVTGAAMVLTNGMVSFRGIGNAPVSPVSGITYQGVNDYQLNSASNAPVASYTFDTGLGASNYRKLQLVGANPTWQGTALTIGSGGALVVSNATGAVIGATVSNAGTISVVGSTVTWSGNVAISGKYVSDPSTNTFLADVTVDPSGTLAGGAGDLFDFHKSLFINSTNNSVFDLATSAVEFSGGGMHTNAIAGLDIGRDATAYYGAFVTQTDFAYGELHLGSAADQVCFMCGNIPGIASNGLYVGWLDLLGNVSLVTNLHAASGINIYYNIDDTRNAYLSGQSFRLTDCSFATGGGFLIAIPEPSAVWLIGAVAGVLLCRKSKRA